MYSRFRMLSRSGAALAGGVALSAYLLHQHTAPIKAAEPDAHIFVINGFYMAMREKYTKPGESISYYLVEWDPKKLSWEDFRGKVLGATDPATAEEGSLRREIFKSWKSLGLKSEPNVGDNGVHASASPFEALAERLNWMGATLEGDDFGKAMLDAGIPKDKIMAWTKDPQVEFEGKKQSLFDMLEDLDYDDCLKKAQEIAGVSGGRPAGKMQAFVFIKPHAVTAEAKALAAKKLAAAGITIYKEGSLGAAQIEKEKLIDNHYYAIANKASLSKPKELNPPAPKQARNAAQFSARNSARNSVHSLTRPPLDYRPTSRRSLGSRGPTPSRRGRSTTPSTAARSSGSTARRWTSCGRAPRRAARSRSRRKSGTTCSCCRRAFGSRRSPWSSSLRRDSPTITHSLAPFSAST